MKLFDYFRSSAAYRVRIALNLKGLSFEQVPVHLARDGGEHKRPEYREINPQARVPALELDDGTVLIQSPAILEYLEETHPEPALLPGEPTRRAKARSVAAIIGCDIHPLNNLAVLTYLRGPLGQPDDAVAAWYANWIAQGFAAIEAVAEGGPFILGDAPSMADVYLVPQIYNARRFKVPLEAYPAIRRADTAAAELDAFVRAAPDRQPDAE